MLYSFGERDNLLIEVAISNSEETPIGVVWGGVQIWLNNIRYGDVSIKDYISGNFWTMVLKLKEENIPIWDFSVDSDYEIIFDMIYMNNFDVDFGSSGKFRLRSIVNHDTYWGRFVLCPNGEMEFDDRYIFFYSTSSGYVTIVYQHPESKNISAINLEIAYVNNIAIGFDNLMKSVIG